jgi:Tfp pilus assembly protein PilF
MQLIDYKYKCKFIAILNFTNGMMDRIERLKSFLVDSPDDSFVQHALALEYIKMGDDAAAKELFNNVLARDENYIGSYYHLAKLLERTGETNAALEVYQKGMRKAQEAGDRHAYSELQMAYDDLADL